MEATAQWQLWKGQWLELQTTEGKIYHSTIMKKEKSYVFLQRPTDQEHIYMPLSSQMPVTIYFHENTGFYAFDTVLKSGENQLYFKYPARESIRNAQRRRFFRVPAHLQVWFDWQSSPSPSDDKTIQLTTLDLSGGGLSFLAPFPFTKEERMLGTLQLQSKHDSQTIHFEGEVVRCVSLQKGNGYRVAMEFTGMTESSRSAIIRYCMMKQIEMHDK